MIKMMKIILLDSKWIFQKNKKIDDFRVYFDYRFTLYLEW